MSARYWFRPKAFGYGANPVTWEGWAVTLGSMVVTMVCVVTAVIAEARQWPDHRPIQAACVLIAAVTLVATIIVSRRRTDGDWRWRP